MSGTSCTVYEVNEYVDDRWKLNMTTYSKKDALERAEALGKAGKKWSCWKRVERSEMIGKG